ncbi:DUF4383 domain-containing protein [Catellatospora vulcania]|uniref:DUF4383 domain-containing protein n=1 Tax=Catellatospora vulcania TaxID=1460450 RepID=UPI0018AF90C6|nr:DUF4383 domain-containing protein [Catellatospora vulcania]
MHLPINHRKRPLWRALAGVAAVCLLVFGLLGVIATSGRPFLDDAAGPVLGLHTSPALAWLSLLLGAAALLGAIVGGNTAMVLHFGTGAVTLLGGLAALALLETPVNTLGLDVTGCVPAFVVGAILLTAGLYGRTGAPREAVAEEVLRHSTRPGDKFAVEPHAEP